MGPRPDLGLAHRTARGAPPHSSLEHHERSLASTLALSALRHSASPPSGEINTADAVTLDRVLVGIGPSKAEAIVVYRKANGAFRSADQLASVKGIGLATIEKNRDRIVVSGAAAPAPAKKGAVKPALAARSGAAR
jgi:competence protein ComEA